MKLNTQDHKLLVLWAADCAERTLPYFEEEYPDDDRPRKAIQAGRAWARSEIEMSEARAAAFAAHAAARDADFPAARFAARATGHVAATAHVSTHAPHAAAYAVKATASTDKATTEEQNWQNEHLPRHLQTEINPKR